MEIIQFNNLRIKCRKEEFGYTLFDGNVSLQVNGTFYDILRDLSLGVTNEEILKHLLTEYELSTFDEKRLMDDIAYVTNYVEKMRWAK